MNTQKPRVKNLEQLKAERDALDKKIQEQEHLRAYECTPIEREAMETLAAHCLAYHKAYIKVESVLPIWLREEEIDGVRLISHIKFEAERAALINEHITQVLAAIDAEGEQQA